MEHSQRKQIRLQNYDYSQNGSYFITLCVQDRKELLGTIVGCDAHIAPCINLSYYGTIVEKYIKNINVVYENITVDKYVIMPNHIHLIISICDGMMRASSPTNSIAVIIRSFKTLVSKQCEFSVFQRSYYDHIIRNQQEYEEISNYIDTNIVNYRNDNYYLSSNQKHKGVSV